MTIGEPAGFELQLLALARADQDTNERIDSVATAVGELTTAVGELVAAKGAAPPPVPWWPSLEGEELNNAWRDLLDWLQTTLLPRRTDVAGALTSCWHRHPVVIDELSMLRATWTVAYQSKTPSPAAVAEWLDRWLPNSRRRIEADVKECRRREHVPPPEPRTALFSGETMTWVGGITPSG